MKTESQQHGEPWPVPVRNEYGAYVAADGCEFSSMADYLGNLLGFCGCGAPEAALGWLRTTLAAIQERSETDWKSRAVEEHFSPLAIGAQVVLWYWLDSLQLIEHGGSVSGSWLTPRGCALLQTLNQLNLE